MKNMGVLTMDQYEKIASVQQGQELESIKKLAGIR
jgi:hypothetical protein